MTAATPGMPMPGSDYPIRVDIDENQPINRLWGIPILGLVIRAILLIPHFFVIWLLGAVAGFSILVSWIPILLNGRPADWMTTLYGGTYRWAARATAYLVMLTDVYPPFSLDGDHPVGVDIAPGQQVNRLWGIPFLGLWFRSIITIPHWIALFFVGIAAYLVMLVAWIPVLASGRMASWGYTVLGGALRWSTRVALYVLMVTDVYPPFRLRD